MQKPLVFVGQNKDACFYVMIALGTDSGSILGPFWFPKSDQIGPKRAPKSIKKVIEKLDAWLNDTMHASIMIG